MKKRGADLKRHYRQAFDSWTRLVPGRPNYVVLCNFDIPFDTPKYRVRLEKLRRCQRMIKCAGRLNSRPP